MYQDPVDPLLSVRGRVADSGEQQTGPTRRAAPRCGRSRSTGGMRRGRPRGRFSFRGTGNGPPASNVRTFNIRLGLAEAPMSHLVIVGGTGYAGSHIAAEAVRRGHEVTSYSRTRAGDPAGRRGLPHRLDHRPRGARGSGRGRRRPGAVGPPRRRRRRAARRPPADAWSRPRPRITRGSRSSAARRRRTSARAGRA